MKNQKNYYYRKYLENDLTFIGYLEELKLFALGSKDNLIRLVKCKYLVILKVTRSRKANYLSNRSRKSYQPIPKMWWEK